MELIGLLLAAYLITRTRFWRTDIYGLPKRSHFSLARLLETFLNNEPMTWSPNGEDPNVNPHYLWYEQDRS